MVSDNAYCGNMICPSRFFCARAVQPGMVLPEGSVIHHFDVTPGQTRCTRYEPIEAQNREQKQA